MSSDYSCNIPFVTGISPHMRPEILCGYVWHYIIRSFNTYYFRIGQLT